MDEIIFKSRNRLYGAYKMRRSYSAVLAISAFTVLSIFCVIVMISFYDSGKQKEDASETWYFFDMGNPGAMKYPIKKTTPPPSGGLKIPNLTPTVTDSLLIPDTLLNKADGNGIDTTGNGIGNENGIGDGPAYYSVQQPPLFPGGDKARTRFLQQNIIYPLEARKHNIYGSVYIAFIVEKNGEITDIKLLHGIGYGCDDEAIRVISSMPKWSPGKQNGVPVRVHIAIPITFTKNTESTN